MNLNNKRKKYILSLLEEAKKADTDLNQFGAKQHKYELNSTISKEEIKKIETEYNFILPEDYSWFISEVGNGGAGPGYGLYQFGNVIDEAEFLYINEEPIIDHTLTDEEYEKFITRYCNALKNTKSKNKENHLYLQIHQGLLHIANAGMNSDIFLIMTGKDRGRVLFSNPSKLPKLSSFNNFLDWYENWLVLIINYYK